MISRFQQKLIIPTAVRPLIARPALTEQLEAAAITSRVVVLAAPAGWGKTTALAQWASTSSLSVAWYTIDYTDRDPRLFLDYLLHAISQLVPEAATISTQLGSASPQSLSELYHETQLAIAAAPTPFVLVLDDFHVLEDESLSAPLGTSLIFELLGTIIEYAPDCHLILASRTLPARQGLARLSVQQRAALFDYAALQFQAADVRHLARLAARQDLSDDAAEQLTKRFGGWVAGIVLSLDQAVQPGRVALPSDSVDTLQIHDYFAEQVIAPLDPEIQLFLEHTSVLEELSVPRCNTLRGKSDSARFLDEVRRRGLFAASRGGWLVYHSLLRDFLRARLSKDPEREQRMLVQAGDLYRDEEDLERAIGCYLVAGAKEQAVAALRAAAPRFLQHSRQTTLLTCLEQIGQNQHLPPDLLLIQARVYRDLALWERAKLAIQLAETLGDVETQWEATLLHAELLNLQGDHLRAITLLDTIPVAELPPRLQFSYYRTAGRVQVLAAEIPAAIATLEHAHTLALASIEAASDPGTLATLYDLLGWAYAMQRDWPATLRHLQRADACWQASGNKGRRAMTLNNLGAVAMEEGRYVEARAAFETGLALAQETGRRREELTLRCSMADLDLYEGQFARALARFKEAHALASHLDLADSIEAAAVGALWVAAICGESNEAATWQQIVAKWPAPRIPEVRGRKSLAASLLLLRQPRTDSAEVDKYLMEALAVENVLLASDRCYVALLQAAQAFERDGWMPAAASWELFEQRAAGLTEVLLMQFVPPYRRLFEVAAQTSPLAQRLISARQVNRPRHWRITALGRFSCLVDGVAYDLSPLHRALLVRLLDAGPKGLPIEQAWEDVWGESDISMSAMHQALYRLRTQTGLAAAARDGICTILSPWNTIEYDAHALEKILDEPISSQVIQRAVALYQGDFLTSGPPSATLWADARRAHIRQRYLDALEAYARSLEATEPLQASQHYQQILQVDGCREQTALWLMQLAARVGNRSLVTETYNQLVGSLRTLGTTPEPATIAFLRTIMR